MMQSPIVVRAHSFRRWGGGTQQDRDPENVEHSIVENRNADISSKEKNQGWTSSKPTLFEGCSMHGCYN